MILFSLCFVFGVLLHLEATAKEVNVFFLFYGLPPFLFSILDLYFACSVTLILCVWQQQYIDKTFIESRIQLFK